MRTGNSKIGQYKTVNNTSGVAAANPHGLIQMLYDGALERLSRVKGLIAHKEYEKKGELINEVVAIVGTLQSSLNPEFKEESVTQNLDALYDYMERRLFEAHLKNDTAIIDEVSGLVRELSDAWREIKPEADKLFEQAH